MKRLTIYPKEDLKNKLQEESKKQGRSVNNLILFILNNYFKQDAN